MLLTFLVAFGLFDLVNAALTAIPIASVRSWPGNSVNFAVDNDPTTSWTSDACRAGSWRSNNLFNLLLAGSNFSTSSCDLRGTGTLTTAGSLAGAEDNNPYTAGYVTFSHGEGRSWAEFLFPNGPSTITNMYIRGIWPASVKLTALTTSSDGTVQSNVFVTNLYANQSYLDINIPYPVSANTLVRGFRLEARTRDGVMRGFCYANIGDCRSLTVTEISAQKQECFEQLFLDLGSLKNIQQVQMSYTGVYGGNILASIDGNTFFTVGSLSSALNWKGTQTFSVGMVTARYLRLVYFTDPTGAYNKVNVNNVAVLGDQNLLISTSTCPNGCSSRGICIPATSGATCSCNSGFGGVDCSLRVCSPSCLNGGTCLNGTCSCAVGFGGVSCANPVCPKNCWGQGTCNNGRCVCNAGFGGLDCRYNMKTLSSSGQTNVIKYLDYPNVASDASFLPSPATTQFNRVANNAAVAAGCTPSAPVLCPDNTCGISIGSCVGRSTIINQKQWSASSYTTNTLPVSSVSATSNTASSGFAVDNSLTTTWTSGSCYPTNYLTYGGLNLLSGVCAQPGKCSMSGSTTTSTSTLGSAATDLNTNTAVGPSNVGGQFWMQFPLPVRTTLVAITAKLSVPKSGVRIFGITSSGSSVLLGRSTVSYTFTNFDLTPSTEFVAVQLWANASFSAFEVAARSSACFEALTVDYGTVQPISALTVRHYSSSPSIKSTSYSYSSDGTTWILLRSGADVPPALLGALDVLVQPVVQARYIRVQHQLFEQMTATVNVWEVSAWGSNGKYGSVSAARPNPVSFRDLFGVNAIWAWGGQGWSNLARDGWGPRRVNAFSSHARNYHNWNWDVKDPDNIPKFEEMSCGGGTEAQWWLSWDWEYAGWNAAGLEVEACIQFTSSMFAQSSFNNPFAAGYNYGFAFAKHFGRKQGTGLVSALEVGNEPWIANMGYSDPKFYQAILSGMSKGVKDADASLKVLPAAFGSLSDWLARVNISHLPYLDGINVHAYSWSQTVRGRTGVYPEHPMSTLNEVNAYLRFRDSLLPGMPVYLTEWGWDSAGGGETCAPPAGISGPDFSECVTELAQALYAVRGALVLARKGLSRLTWFFYGNTDQSVSTWQSVGGVFSRSGLMSTASAGFVNKLSSSFLKQFMSVLGSSNFLSVIQEDYSAYVYVLGDANSGVPTHIVAWRPVADSDTSSTVITFQYSSSAFAAWQFSPTSLQKVDIPSTVGGVWVMRVSGFPTIVELSSSPSAADCSPSCVNGGVCHDGKCVCPEGYRGPSCSQVTCPSNNCWGRGTCRDDGTCACELYWSTSGQGEYQHCTTEISSCSNPVQFDSASGCMLPKCSNDCSGHGTCTTSGCVCQSGYQGSSCEIAPCPFNCRSHGVCNANSQCTCRPGFVGASCEWMTVIQGSNTCPATAPVQCNDKSCARSQGACVLKDIAAADQAAWSANVYASAPLSVSAVRATSNLGSTGNSIDDYLNTAWTSGSCYPTGFVQNNELNFIAGICSSSGFCSSSGSVSGIAAATDGDINTAYYFSGTNNNYWTQLNFNKATSLAAVALKLSSPQYGVRVLGVTQSGGTVLLGIYASSYSLSNFDVAVDTAFTGIKLLANSSFGVFEVAARSSACFEALTVDYGTVQPISALTIRHYSSSPSIKSTSYSYSSDGTTWILLRSGADVPPALLGALDVLVQPVVQARYIRVQHQLFEQMTATVNVWEVSAWGPDGKFGKEPVAQANPSTFRSLLGVNGIWGWGSNMFSVSMKSTYNARNFSTVASHARNYQNWNWDVQSPQLTPRFDQMVAPGSNDYGAIPGHGSLLAQDWLNWDTEYTAWKAAGLNVEVSISFTSNMFSQALFGNAYQSGYKYGYAFGKHFGRTSGTGDVDTVEVGNEPWIAGMGYPDPAFYRQVLAGMTQGLKDADATLRVLPAAFGSLSDLLARVNASQWRNIDGINVHAYSWSQTVRGRTGVYPEHPMSTLNEVNAYLRFRDSLLPGMPVYLTEWGWDSAGGGETCAPPAGISGPDFSECVTELAQALYAVRGALVLARKGLSRLTWFFYGNTLQTVSSWQQVGSGVFSRSGLTSSSAAGFKRKLAFTSLEQFVALVGSSSFLSVIREDLSAYVYVLGNADNGVPSHVVAWRPAADSDMAVSIVNFPSALVPISAKLMVAGVFVYATVPSVADGIWSVQISNGPIVIAVRKSA